MRFEYFANSIPSIQTQWNRQNQARGWPLFLQLQEDLELQLQQNLPTQRQLLQAWVHAFIDFDWLNQDKSILQVA